MKQGNKSNPSSSPSTPNKTTHDWSQHKTAPGQQKPKDRYDGKQQHKH